MNSRTHIAEAWLLLAWIRLLSYRIDEACDAAGQAYELISTENPPLIRNLQVLRGCLSVLTGDESSSTQFADEAFEPADNGAPIHIPTLANVILVRALAARMAGDRSSEAIAVAEAMRTAAASNNYLPTSVDQFWAHLSTVPDALQAGAKGVQTADISHEPDEIIDVYDEDGEQLGRSPSLVAHRLGLWHRSFHCWIVRQAPDGTTFLLFQRRGQYARNFPNKLDMTAAGHYRAGEGVEGGIRECAEELGIAVDAAELTPIARRIINETLSNGVVNREFQDIYLLRRDAPAADYRPGFPEVSAVVECTLEGVIDVLTELWRRHHSSEGR